MTELESSAGIVISTPGDRGEEIPSRVRSLRELIDRATGRGAHTAEMEGDAGLAEALPFPFLALVGQKEMKIALLLSLVNPGVGGVLLVGPRGTGKTTAVRGLVDLLLEVPRSLCYHGCMPEDVETGGIDAICPDCARKYGAGEPLAAMDRVRLV
jgi:magnesium chelatase subunit I